MNSTEQRILRGAATLAVGVLILALCSCGSDPGTPGSQLSAARPGAPGAAASGAASGNETNAPAVVVKSTFKNTPQSGRDPFFPDSRRALAQATEAPVVRLPTISYLKLTGVRAGTARPMALINQTAFAPGDERDVAINVTNQLNKAESQKVLVRCLEIRRDSVLIKIAGDHGAKELRLAPPADFRGKLAQAK